MNRFAQALAQRPWLLADGATGSNLFEMGLVSGDAPELWNVEHPDRIALLHRRFIDAGADIILTNSFGGNAMRLKLHQAQGRVGELNEAAARIARREADAACARAGREVIVAGSIGPTGEVLQPVGALTAEEAARAFAEQAQALARGGADVMWIETMSSKEEVAAAVEGAATTGLPIVVTMSFDTHGSTMMGVTAAEFIAFGRTLPQRLAACGSNCGVGAAEVVAGMLNMKRANDRQGDGPVLVAKGNCGVPRFVDGAIRYDGTPELMAVYARMALDAGARIIGGCCGTSPEHLRAMRRALDAHTQAAAPTIDEVEAALGEVSRGAKALWDGAADLRVASRRASGRRAAGADRGD
ncbi:MAG TPA: betaine--homocysteine S-methyltransferase [Burkholderiaceae bacterium]|nr:betaine--homocysteine S-methyltransferase [Burkholderiaceae bacterium]